MILINRQEAIEGVANAIWHYPNHSVLNVYDKAHELAEYAFRQVVFAEPERKPGRWIYLGDGYKCPWSCSKCSSCSDERTDYCPMCGAKMEGEKDG